MEKKYRVRGKKKALYCYKAFDKLRQRLTLPRFTVVPSARVGLTALFGMGRGDPHRYSHLKTFPAWRLSTLAVAQLALRRHGFMV